ncbi:MAG: DMT family transporter [Sphaerochaetaceae bacterium]|nr:DMT family transporter [Sphaerochaetaceae bacterium]
MWIALVAFYGIAKGIRETIKKKALETNSVLEVLVVYTVISFIFCLPQAPQAMGLEGIQYLWIAVKAFFVFLAWICGFKALGHLPISIYGVIDLSGVIFSTLLGVIVLGESLNIYQILGLAIMITGFLLLRLRKRNIIEDKEKSSTESTALFVLLAFGCCLFNSISGLMDKILMKNMNSSQMQFFFMLFLVLFYVIYILISRTKIRLTVLKNVWIYVMALLFVAGDKALFMANAYPESSVTVMTLIKQVGTLVAIISGRIVFKEKDVGYRLFCASIILLGIVCGVLGAQLL